jgi:hypothetical protein
MRKLEKKKQKKNTDGTYVGSILANFGYENNKFIIFRNVEISN